MLKTLVNILFFSPQARNEMNVRDNSVLHHMKQIDRALVPQVDSEIVAKHEWAANFNLPGKYVYEGRE